MADTNKAIRAQLEEELKRLQDELAQMETDAQSPENQHEGSPFGKREEEAEESVNLEKRLAMEKRLGGAASEVELAIQKLEKGTYGLCNICGKPIPPARLEALPQAILCLDCKAKTTKTGRTG